MRARGVVDPDRDKVTQILQSPDQGQVSDRLLPLVYDQLRKLATSQMARETPGQTLQPTALVHEAYLRLVSDAEVKWENRGHFFATAARAMRRILINRAHRRKAKKHGGDLKRHEFSDAMYFPEPRAERLIALDDALNRLEQVDVRKAKIVMLRYYAGLGIDDTAQCMGLSPATVKRDWQFARAWLQREMGRETI